MNLKFVATAALDRDKCMTRHGFPRLKFDGDSLRRQLDHIGQIGSVNLAGFEFEQNNRP